MYNFTICLVILSHTVDASPARKTVEVGSLCHYVQGFIHPTWCRIFEPSTARTWKLGIGRWFSFWKGFLVGAMLVSGRVTCPLHRNHFKMDISSSKHHCSGGILVLGRVKKLNFVTDTNFLKQVCFNKCFFNAPTPSISDKTHCTPLGMSKEWFLAPMKFIIMPLRLKCMDMMIVLRKRKTYVL